MFAETKSYISGSHVPDERPGDGHQGHTVIPIGAINWRLIRHLGT